MKSKYSVLVGSIVIILLSGILAHPFSHFNNYETQLESPNLSSLSNSDIIKSIFNTKIENYTTLGYFPQIYEPSLRATYYGLYILESLGKLHEINQTEILDYIMSHYNPSTNRFMDTLAYRYLDSDFSLTYFPLSTVLEVNCYAVLSLDILNSTSLIDTDEMIDFIWDCQYLGGFIGQEYDSDLDAGFKVPTADNAFFAVLTLEVLMDDWSSYSIEKDAIIQFINDLQISGSFPGIKGGFRNDEDLTLDTLNPFFEPSLLSSYYSIKTLEVLGMEYTINNIEFHQFLDNLYSSQYHYFLMSIDGMNYTNIVASALGLELSEITNYLTVSKDEVFEFIMGNRNSYGNWDQSTKYKIHELIDTFQIIRALRNNISQFSQEEINQIGNTTLMYTSYGGFALLSEDFTSCRFMNAFVSSLAKFDKLSSLDIQNTYLQLKYSYNDFTDFGISRFFQSILTQDTSVSMGAMRSFPIEYFTTGQKNYIEDISMLNSHESTYHALNSLEKLYKLDDFAGEFDIMSLLNDIVATQFLNESYYNIYGSFSPILKYNDYWSSEIISKRLYFEYTYYAIRSLEIISNQLSLNFTGLGFDVNALYTYLDRNTVETSTILYFSPRYISNVEIILQNTYYMIYILKALNLFNKDIGKIRNYVMTALNYNNIKNVYYCYKISEILNLGINFNVELTQNLVNSIFCKEYSEFYLNTDKNKIDQNAFLWICEMARDSSIQINAQYSDIIELGEINHMEVSLHNLIVNDFGSYITFKFESNQTGAYIFDKIDNNTYVKDIPIPMEFEYFPIIQGVLRAYEGARIKAETNIMFGTSYGLEYNLKINNSSTTIMFEVNGSLLANNSKYPLSIGNVFTKIYRDTVLYDQKDFSRTDFNLSSTFYLEYFLSEPGEYYFDILLNDQVRDLTLNIGNSSFTIEGPEPPPPKPPKNYDGEINAAIPLIVACIAVPGCVIGISTRQLNKTKKNRNHH
ncbi:MAG: hypothetical protein ACFE9Q_11280 [Candidatus Hodarchaeota archaeon]